MENKLISMTDFVIEVIDNTAPINFIKGIESLRTYAKFLKQPLTLGMFVPVDEEGNVLEEPKQFEGKFKDYQNILDTYVKAKEKVLFEGFEVEDIGLGSFAIRKWRCIIMKCSKAIGAKWENVASYQTIEDLVNLDLQLTPSALKAIGIKE